MMLKSVLTYSALLMALLFLLLLYILGAARYVTDFEENTCEMTYMFEYPQYVRITMDKDIEEKYPRYDLYAYGEGFVTEKHRKMQFTGIPVLFIPGNAGSHEQVRSLASVSLRKSLKDRTPFHFDFFTISFNKDYSALYGGVLLEETEYVSHCIKTILNLYKGNMKNIVLIGHSMGGIVAKGALLLVPNINPNVASIMINLAAPHTPSLVLDSTFASYYRNLEDRLHLLKQAGVNVVSIGGGPRDILVPAAQTLDLTADINVLSTSIPDVWKSTDHLCILWCKQLVLSIVRSLFDSVDYTQKPPGISSHFDHRMKALSYHFLHRTAGKKVYHHKEIVQFESNGVWLENSQEQFSWNGKISKVKKIPVYLMIKIMEQFDHLFIETINMEAKDWLFACTAIKRHGESTICEWGWNLTNNTRMTPDHLLRLRKSIDLDLKEIKYPDITHILVKVPPDDLERVTVNIDFYSQEARTFFITDGFTKNIFSFSKSHMIKPIPGKIRYYVKPDSIINVVTVEMKSTECTNIKQSPHAIIEMLEPPNTGATQVRVFTNVDNGPETIRTQTTHKHMNVTSVLRLTLDPLCSYTFSIRESGIIDQISCKVRDRWPLLYIVIMSFLMLTISMRTDDSDKVPTIVVTIILSFYFGVAFESCVALAILCIFAVGTCCSVIFLGSVAHGIAVRFLARAITFSTTWSDWLLSGLSQLSSVTTSLLLSLTTLTCGALSMLIAVFLYFLKLTRMYEDYLEELLLSSLQHFRWTSRLRFRTNKESAEESENTREKILNHLLFFLLWCFTAIPAIPTVLVWAKNFSYDRKLSTEDSLLLTSWAILVTCSTTGIAQITSNCGNRSRILAGILRCISWIVLSMAAAPRPPFYQFYMPPIVAAIVVLISLNFLVPKTVL